MVHVEELSEVEEVVSLSSLPIRELRARLEARGIATRGLCEKSDLVEALQGALDAESTAAPADADAAGSAAMDADVAGSAATPASAGANVADSTAMDTAADSAAASESSEDDEAALLAQAMLMSEESTDSLSSLPVKELRARLEARGIATRGLCEKSDLVEALQGSLDAESTAAPAPSSAATPVDEVPGVSVLAQFGMPFCVFPAEEAGLGSSLEQTGKIFLPRSMLAALMHLGEAMPTTMLLRITYQGRTAIVGVADFIDDAAAMKAASEASAAGGGPQRAPRWGLGVMPGMGGVAALFVPRWVRSQLACPAGDELALALVVLPKASALRLQPHTDLFAAALSRCGDPRAVLTELMNRYVAVSVGDVIHLSVGEERHALDVVAIRGLPGVSCGLPPGAAQRLDIGAALRGLSTGDDAARGVGVRAACLVDADVECEFQPSVETSVREEAEQAAKAVEEASARAAASAPLARPPA